MSHRNGLRIAPLLLLMAVSRPTAAFLPDDAPVPGNDPAPAHRVSPKPDKARYPSKTSFRPKRDWCLSKGGSRDEYGRCARNLSPAECENIGGLIDARGVCLGSPENCDRIGGKYNENGDCIF